MAGRRRLRLWAFWAVVAAPAAILQGAAGATPSGTGGEGAELLRLPLLCDEAAKAAWQRVGDLLREGLPWFTGRLPFVAMAHDVDLLARVRRELVHLELHEVLLTGQALPEEHSDCELGLLSLRVFLMLAQASFSPTDTPSAAAAVVAALLEVRWTELLLGSWPAFAALATLARWASPHTDPQLHVDGGSQAEAARTAAARLPSSCDASEVGAVPVARHLLGAAWRRSDPLYPSERVQGAERSPEAEVEAALASVGDPALEGAVWGGRAGRCRWTQHAGRYLGGFASDDPGAGVEEDLVLAMGACDREPACAGVTLEPAAWLPRGVRFTLRLGEPLLHSSPSAEISYVRWCSGSGSPTPATAAPCSFGRATGLLAVAMRRLAVGSLQDFAPELLVEAQEELVSWAARRGDGGMAGAELWATEWPLWELLGRLQRRIDLLLAPGGGSGFTPPPPWVASLQRVLGLDDEAWRLATSELSSLEEHARAARAVPPQLRRSVRCATGRQCAGELFARLHLAMHGGGLLPLRDPIFIRAEDSLASVYMQRSGSLVDGIDYDWRKMAAADQRRLEEAVAGGFGDPTTEELDLLMPKGHPLQVDRRQLATFLLRVHDIIGREPMLRCLEWDEPFVLVRAFQGLCRWSDVFSYSEPSPENPMMGMPGRQEYPYGTRHYWGDLEHVDGLGIEPHTFDLIVCPFVFEHVSQPFVAIRNLAHVLRPGGYVIWAAPMFQQYHGSPHDYFRYTPKGARALAKSAGLEVVHLYAPGDLALVSGVLMGMMLPYWQEQQALREEEPHGKDDSPRHPLNVFALLRKPPLPAAPAPATGAAVEEL